MAGKTISQLEEATSLEGDTIIMQDGHTRKISHTTIGEYVWKHMYEHAKSVIIACKFCKSHNAISNATCVQCGAPMGAE